MRKAEPQDVRDDFAEFATETIEHFDRLENSIRGTAHEKRDLSILSERTLHSVYVAFECFLSDLIVAYLNRDFTQYQDFAESCIKQSVESKYGQWIATRTSLGRTRHVKLDQIEEILDPKDYNVTFKDVATLKTSCENWLIPQQRRAIISLGEADTRLIDTVHAIRNFIAHQSTSSKKTMNDRLHSVVTGPRCPNQNLGRAERDIHDVGAFLKSSFPRGRRVKLYIDRLSGIAATL